MNILVLEQEEYEREGIQWQFIDFGLDLQAREFWAFALKIKFSCSTRFSKLILEKMDIPNFL